MGNKDKEPLRVKDLAVAQAAAADQMSDQVKNMFVMGVKNKEKTEDVDDDADVFGTRFAVRREAKRDRVDSEVKRPMDHSLDGEASRISRQTSRSAIAPAPSRRTNHLGVSNVPQRVKVKYCQSYTGASRPIARDGIGCAAPPRIECVTTLPCPLGVAVIYDPPQDSQDPEAQHWKLVRKIASAIDCSAPALLELFRSFVTNIRPGETHVGPKVFHRVWSSRGVKDRVLVQRVFNEFVDVQGRVDFRDMIKAFLLVSSNTTTEKLALCFEVFDLDMDGSLSFNELTKVATRSQPRDRSDPAPPFVTALTAKPFTHSHHSHTVRTCSHHATTAPSASQTRTKGVILPSFAFGTPPPSTPLHLQVILSASSFDEREKIITALDFVWSEIRNHMANSSTNDYSDWMAPGKGTIPAPGHVWWCGGELSLQGEFCIYRARLRVGGGDRSCSVACRSIQPSRWQLRDT